jgi:hypothetical protein
VLSYAVAGRFGEDAFVCASGQGFMITQPLETLTIAGFFSSTTSHRRCRRRTGGERDVAHGQEVSEDQPPAPGPASLRGPCCTPSLPESTAGGNSPGGRPGELKLSLRGQLEAWDDGVAVTVGKPREFKPSEYVAAKKAKSYLKFTVTVVNKSEKPLDLGLTYS